MSFKPNFGVKNSPERAQWYDEVLFPLRRMARELPNPPGGIGKREKWMEANLKHDKLRGTAQGRAWDKRIQRNLRFVSEAHGVPYSNLVASSMTFALIGIGSLTKAAELGKEATAELLFVPPAATTEETDILVDEDEDEGLSLGVKVAAGVGVATAAALAWRMYSRRTPSL